MGSWRAAVPATLAALLALLAAAPRASAHENRPAEFESTVTSVRPLVPGLDIRVLDGDDQLLLVNDSGRELVVKGYAGEPYLRFNQEGVFQNTRSPAVYLNAGRSGDGRVPDTADPTAAPRWQLLTDDDSYSWHDHRIQWMGGTLPPAVEAAPDERRRIVDWTVPLEAAGRPVTVAGTLEYVPGTSTSPRWWLLGVLLGLAALGGGAALVLYARRPPGATPAADGPGS